jgi:glucose 1-dehydrogenase
MAEGPLHNRVALVTGASLGIGRAAALALGQAGAKVAINYLSHATEADEVARAIDATGSASITVQGDVADAGAVERLVAETIRAFGRLDIAVSNAAYSDRDMFYEADMEGFRRTVNVTMWGAFYVTRASARQMIAQGHGGSIVVVSSPHAFLPVPRSMAYNMSKAAIEQMAKTAAIELAEYGIRVNIVQPGWTDTPGERKFADEETLKRAGSKIPMGRLGHPDDIARGIVFLCDPRSEYVTGSSLLIDGGITLPWWTHRGSAVPP